MQATVGPTKKNRILRIILGISVPLVLLLMLGIIIWLALKKTCPVQPSSSPPPQNASGSTPLEKSRHRIGLMMKQSMDLEVDPCQDFYRFSCGGFMNKTTRMRGNVAGPPGSARRGIINGIWREVALMKKPIKRNYEHSYERKFKVLAQQCLRLPKQKKQVTTDLLALLDEMGAYPLHQDRVSVNWDMVKALEVINIDFFADTVFQFDYLEDGAELTLMPGKISIHNPKSFTKEEFDKQWAEKNKNEINLLKQTINMSDSDALAFLTTARDFDKKLALIRSQDDSVRHKEVSLKELDEETNDTFSILQLLQRMPKQVSENDRIKLQDEEYFDKLWALLKVADAVEVRNYFILRLIPHISFIMTGNADKCIQTLVKQKYMRPALDALYIEKFGSQLEESILITEEMALMIRGVVTEQITDIDWMSEETKLHAAEKLRKMGVVIGYEKEMANVTVVDEIFSHLQVSENNTILKNVRQFHHFRMRSMIIDLKGDFPYFLATHIYTNGLSVVNAFYVFMWNALVGNIGGIKEWVLPDAPYYINYGKFGYVLGHEMTHGYDKNGRFLDADGYINDWWSDESNAGYEKKMECLVRHYGKFTADGWKIDANLTLAENTADVGGLKLARVAWESTHIAKTEKPLPGLENFSTKQLFYIAFGQHWCEKWKKRSYLENSHATDNHAPGEVRVSGTVSLLHDFAQAFGCPSGTPMNPKEQCLMRD